MRPRSGMDGTTRYLYGAGLCLSTEFTLSWGLSSSRDGFRGRRAPAARAVRCSARVTATYARARSFSQRGAACAAQRPLAQRESPRASDGRALCARTQRTGVAENAPARRRRSCAPRRAPQLQLARPGRRAVARPAGPSSLAHRGTERTSRRALSSCARVAETCGARRARSSRSGVCAALPARQL
jgi:hypothetical protein